MSAVQLRPYQSESVDGLRNGIRAGHRKQVLMASTGAGKTEIACHLLEEARNKMARALFIVDRVVLIDQTSERLDRYGIPHGVIQAGHWRCRPWERIQVCSAQTLERRGIPEDVTLVIVDECHAQRKKISEFLDRTQAVVVGLSATPLAKGMGKVYSNLVNVTTMDQLIEMGFLVPLRAYAAKAINTKGMKIIAGEWSEKEIEERGIDIIGDIVAEWQDKTNLHFGGPAKTIVFSATVDHGEELCRQFQAAGFNFRQISYRDGGDTERRELVEEFKKADSNIVGLVSCEVLTKGFDCPDVMIGVSARPYRKSLSSHIQQLGRVMRTAPEKKYAVWLDHSGNFLRFAKDVQDIFANGLSELDDGKREAEARKEPTEREKKEMKCSCGCVMNPWDTACAGCGKVRKRNTMIENLPGEMAEVENKKSAPINWPERIKFMSGLRQIGINKGRAPGWAAHKYREKYGVWPNDPRVHNVAASPPDYATLRWVQHAAIKFAKRRNK